MTVRAARRIPDLQPGSEPWMKLMTASKVSAILGLSPWESRFSLYYRMAGQLPGDSGNASTRRGTYLEDAVATWLADQRTDLRFGRTGTWVSKARPWQSATPDRLVFDGRQAVGVAEIKTSAEYEGWGRDGSDDIPAYYRTQVVWQMDTLGLPTGHVAVLLPRLAFRSYVIRYDSGEAAWIRNQVTAFLDTLPGGPNETPPDIDDHDSTWEAVRRLHPQIEDREVEVDLDVAQRFVTAIRESKAAQAVEQEAKSEMALLMGNAIRAILPRPGFEPLNIAVRQAKGSGVPYVAAKRPLPELEGI